MCGASRISRSMSTAAGKAEEAKNLNCRQPYINNKSIQNTETTVWLMSTLLHTFRDEDGTFATPSRTFWGTASTMWTGFDMKPHNLFETHRFIRRCRRRDEARHCGIHECRHPPDGDAGIFLARRADCGPHV